MLYQNGNALLFNDANSNNRSNPRQIPSLTPGRLLSNVLLSINHSN